MLPQYRLHTDLSKEAYAENLAKIASELSVLEPIKQGVFFVPNPDRKLYVPDKILCCLNIATQEFTWKKSGFLNKALRPCSLRSLAARGLAGINKIMRVIAEFN